MRPTAIGLPAQKTTLIYYQKQEHILKLYSDHLLAQASLFKPVQNAGRHKKNKKNKKISLK